MAEKYLNALDVEAAVLGGAVLGGGGGGPVSEGRERGEMALRCGTPRLVEISDLPDDAVLVTCAEVGAPSSPDIFLTGEDAIRAVELLRSTAGIQVDGLIACECGGNASILGWIPSAALGIPVVDAPCDGRAHPTGIMGAMGLHRFREYTSLQAASGGDPAKNRHVEAFLRGSLEAVAPLIRQISVHAGGMAAVARNPISAAHVCQNGAPGAIAMSMAVGRAMLAAWAGGGAAVAQAAAASLGGSVAAVGQVDGLDLNSSGGFDTGRVQIGKIEVTFWNEYMTLESDGRRLATFPDLIMTLDGKTGEPLTSAQLALGREVILLVAPYKRLILGSGLRDRSQMALAETVTGKTLLPFLDPDFFSSEGG